nr:nucleolin-like [Procambarus clarkii]
MVVPLGLCTRNKSVKRLLLQSLESFKGFRNDFSGSGGRYVFLYHVGDSERQEERNDDGEVRGQYAFVAPEGDEYHFKYDADKDGYRVESEALPEAPEDTEDVKRAKEAFFLAYKKALELAEGDDYEYSEESHESNEEESSEESDEDDEESGEDEDEDSHQRLFQGTTNFETRFPYPYITK